MNAATRQNVSAPTTKKASAKAAQPSKEAPKAPEVKKEEKGPQDITRAELVAAGTDMNEKMGLEPAINVKLATQAIARDIMKNAAELDFTDFDGSKAADEQITDATKNVLTALGFNVPAAPKKEDKPAAKDQSVGAVKAAKVKTAKEMKADKAAKATKKADAAPRYGRIESIVDAIKATKKSKKPATFEEINETSCVLFDKANDEVTPRPYSNTWLKASLSINAALGCCSFDAATKKYNFNV